MIEIRPYIPADYMRINRRHFDSLTFMSFPNPKLIAQNLARGAAFTGVADGEIIACGGILPLWKGVGEAWVVSSELVNLYPLTFAKVIWRKLRSIIKELELVRVQTTVHENHKISIAWLERMGFKNEGLMRLYLGGQNYYRFAWVKE